MNTFLTGISIEPSIFFQNITTWVARLDFIGVVVEDDAKYKSTSIEKKKTCILLNRIPVEQNGKQLCNIRLSSTKKSPQT